jgi:hypothetical protein
MAVYFFGCDEGYVKIGRSENVARRLKQTNSHSPFEMRVLAVIDGSYKEQRFLDRFRSQHVRGEWFRFEGNLKAFIENCASTQDVRLICAEKSVSGVVVTIGAQKLARYLKETKVKPINFADIIGVDRSTISRILSGARIPRRETIQKIEAVTNGAVTPSDFFTEAA